MRKTKEYYLKVLDVQRLYIEKKRENLSNEFIYITFIRPQFYISKSTFYRYLAEPALRKLQDLTEKDRYKTRRKVIN